MQPRTRRLLGLALAGAGIGYVVGPGRRRAVRRISTRVRPDIDDDWYDLPDGVTTREVPTHDGGSVHVVEIGEGRPLVLLHGVTLAAEVWAPLMHLAADRFRIVALDVRGHGASVVGDDGVGRVPAAHDLATVLETLDLTDAIVVGHSMGGMILGRFCGDHPEVLRDRVAGLVFMDTAVSQLIPPGLDVVADRVGAAILAREAAGAVAPKPHPDVELLMTRLAFGARPSGRAVQVTTRLGRDIADEYRSKLWIDLYATDNRDGLARVTQPATVIVGSRDALTPVWAARRIIDNLVDGELVVLPGVGHQAMQEDPRAVVAALGDLVTRIEARETTTLQPA
jgi:pimeloyl-ACP methyl ester carboxylesterase